MTFNLSDPFASGWEKSGRMFSASGPLSLGIEERLRVVSRLSVLLNPALRPSPPSEFFLQHRPDRFALTCQRTHQLTGIIIYQWSIHVKQKTHIRIDQRYIFMLDFIVYQWYILSMATM